MLLVRSLFETDLSYNELVPTEKPPARTFPGEADGGFTGELEMAAYRLPRFAFHEDGADYWLVDTQTERAVRLNADWPAEDARLTLALLEERPGYFEAFEYGPAQRGMVREALLDALGAHLKVEDITAACEQFVREQEAVA